MKPISSSSSEEPVLRGETDLYVWSQSKDDIVMTLRSSGFPVKKADLDISITPYRMKLFVKGQVVFDSKLFSGKVVPSESYCTISDGEVDVFLCKSHKTTNKAEWWPSLFQGDPLMPRLPAMAQSPDLKPPSSFPARRGPSRCGKLCLGVLGLLFALILLLTVAGFALSQSRDLRHQTFAFVWEHMAPHVHGNLRPQKEALFSEYRHKLRGRVLELGPGFGANFQHFPKDGSMTWVGIEPNTYMLDGLREAVELSGFPADHAEVVGASAEDFFASVPDNSIDTVVATLVLCSVHDQGRVVAEIARVLKPGGSFLLLEHMAADPFTLDRQLQDWLTPLWALFGDNCHLNRPTNELFDNGFPDPWIDIELKRFDFPSGVSFLKPAIYGLIQKIDHSKYTSETHFGEF